MVRARLRVHQLPAFAALAAALRDLCRGLNPGSTVLDIGCGDGFFLDALVHDAVALRTGIGIDISKDALSSAARSRPECFFIRTDGLLAPLPFGDAAFGFVLSIFAPRPMAEIARVLGPEGFWIVVTANQEHIGELRDYLPLASIGPDKQGEIALGEFTNLSNSVLRRSETVFRDDLIALVEMSPSVYRLRREQADSWRERIPDKLTVTFSFSISLLSRKC